MRSCRNLRILPFFRIRKATPSLKPLSNIDGKVVEVKKDLFTLSNFVSFSRMLVPIPLIWMGPPIGRPEPLFTVLVVWAILSDFLDGYLARLLNQRSELGKILDPIADKICAGLLFVFAVWVDRIPWWFLAIIILRDLLILFGSWFIIKRHRKVAMSVMSGKIAVNILAALWITVMYFPEQKELYLGLMAASLFFLGYSFLEYVNRFRLIYKGSDFN